MFSLLDRLEGWQLLLLLCPLMLIMAVIRKREESAASMRLKEINELQKGWVFLSLLAPGLAAKLLTMLKTEERDRLLEAGGNLKGSPRHVAFPVLESFFRKCDLKGIPGKDVDEICRWLNLRFEDEPEELVGHLRKAYL